MCGCMIHRQWFSISRRTLFETALPRSMNLMATCERPRKLLHTSSFIRAKMHRTATAHLLLCLHVHCQLHKPERARVQVSAGLVAGVPLERVDRRHIQSTRW